MLNDLSTRGTESSVRGISGRLVTYWLHRCDRILAYCVERIEEESRIVLVSLIEATV